MRSNTGSRFLGGGFSRTVFTHTYEDIISIPNLLAAWREFVRGKSGKPDVQEFQYRLFGNIFALHTELKYKTYAHGSYRHFKVNDPKPRDIHKASVRDRLVHHAIYRVLYPFFDRTFIADSYSCRNWKGTHKAMNRFRTFARKVSENDTRTCWVLKCDIRKFFASVDQHVLRTILERYITDSDILLLLDRVIGSFYSTEIGKGLPLGNLTSQLLVNIYMNEFDQFMKHTIKARYYTRYADDFVIVSRDRRELEAMLPKIDAFLHESLKLTLHPQKVSIATLVSGVDFLGWVHFPGHRALQTATKRRALRRTQGLEVDSPTVRSYLGMMSHGNTRKARSAIESQYSMSGRIDGQHLGLTEWPRSDFIQAGGNQPERGEDANTRDVPG